MSLVKKFPQLLDVDVTDENVKIPLTFLSQSERVQLGRLIAEQTIDEMPKDADRESVNYTYLYYFNVASVSNATIVKALLELKKEE